MQWHYRANNDGPFSKAPLVQCLTNLSQIRKNGEWLIASRSAKYWPIALQYGSSESTISPGFLNCSRVFSNHVGEQAAAVSVSVFARRVLFVYYCEEDCLKASARGKDNAKAKHKHMPATPAGECGRADGIRVRGACRRGGGR